eukprot:6173102-Amphidinium_carterae.1
MAMKRGSSSLLAVMLCIVGACALVSLCQTFVAAPASLRGSAAVETEQNVDFAAAAALGAAVAT